VGREIDNLLKCIDKEKFFAFMRVFEDRSRQWFFSGQGRSGLVAQMAAMRFMHLGYKTHFVGEVSAPSIRKGNGLLIISGSGETPISCSFARLAQEEGATVGVVTAKTNSRLAKMGDHVLSLPVSDSVQFGGSLFEQSALLLMDSIILALAENVANAYEIMQYRHTNMQ